MAYFPNGSTGDDYMQRYCERCAHGVDNQPCPVLSLHMEWNYEAVGKDAGPVKKHALETLWPTKDGFPGQCRMFEPACFRRAINAISESFAMLQEYPTTGPNGTEES